MGLSHADLINSLFMWSATMIYFCHTHKQGTGIRSDLGMYGQWPLESPSFQQEKGIATPIQFKQVLWPKGYKFGEKVYMTHTQSWTVTLITHEWYLAILWSADLVLGQNRIDM